ncbi:MAG: hypothetical protein HY070_07330 [Chloroflexi bacterium]|nr:hypothetical protein [Chloroflexota bacterium]
MGIRRTAMTLVMLVLLVSAGAVYAGGTIVWSSTGGPAGGSINALAVAADALYAGTNTGVFISRDEGATWTLVSNGLPDDRTITALALTPDSKTILAGTHNGVYKSRDAGANWSITEARLADQFVLSLLIDSQNSETIYAGTLTTLLRSDNGGETWKDASEGLRGARVTALALSLDTTSLFAATESAVYISRDRGARWTALSDGLSDNARPQSLAVSSKTILVGTTLGLYRLRDNRWINIGGNFSGAIVRPLLTDPRKPERVFAATSKGLFRSTDGGDNWSPMTALGGDNSFLSFAAGERNLIFSGTTRGVWKSADDGNSWISLNANLISTSINALLILPENSVTLFAATQAGLAISPDRGKTWNDVRGLSENILSLAPDTSTPGTIYAGTLNSALYVTRDNGATFTRLAENVAAGAPLSALAIIRVSERQRLIYAGTLGSGLYRSVDEGKTWIALTNELSGVKNISALNFISPQLYVGTDRGLYRYDLSKSNAAWQLVSSELPTEESRAVITDPRNSLTLFAAFTSKGIFRSDDGGAAWQPIGKGAFPTRVRFQTLAMTPTTGAVMYVGTDRGMYRSEDNGATWSAANDGLPTGAEVGAIAIDPELLRQVFVGTVGYGVLTGNDEVKPAANGWQLPAGITGAVALALGAIVLAWQTRFSPNAQERSWARVWPAWDAAIQHALWTFGQANEINLNKMPRAQLARALQRYKEQSHADALTLTTTPPVSLRLDNYVIAQKFLSHWKAAWEVIASDEAFKSVTSQMVDQLCQLLGFTRVDERSFQGILGYVVKAPLLRLKIPPRFPIIFIPRHEIGEEEIGTLRDLMNVLNMTSYFALIIDLRDAPAPDGKQTLKRLVRKTIHDFIVLDGTDIRRLLAARDHPRRLVEIILDQVDLTVVSPYVTSGPVPENMFFGRDNELKTIIRTVRDTNFAIVGGRKIGKTSMLARVNRLLQEMPDFQPFYLDCQAVRTHADFFGAVDTLWPTNLPAPTPEGFRRMATDLGAAYPGKVIVMLFDEIDALLQYDISQAEQLFRIFRALAQENHIRYIFCGEKVLNASMHDARLVFFNFCNVLSLSYLNPDEARRVVQEPMEEMGITLEEEGALVEEIINQSARHPNIVQFLCQELIKRLNLRRERVVNRNDIVSITQSAQFSEYFIEISWGKANTLERLLTVEMLERREAAPGEMSAWLKADGLEIPPNNLDQAFEGLCLYSILRKDGPKYAFATNAFPEILRRSQDLTALRASLIADIQHADGARG